MLVYGQTFWQYPIHFLPFFILFVILIKSNLKIFVLKKLEKGRPNAIKYTDEEKKEKLTKWLQGKKEQREKYEKELQELNEEKEREVRPF